MGDQVDARDIAWTDQVLGREAYKPNSVHLTHIYLEDDPALPTDPTNKLYVDDRVSELNATIESLLARIEALGG